MNKLLLQKNNFGKLCLSLLFILSQTLLFAQNTLDNAGLNSTAPASAAFSMRKLSTSYSGSAIQVRRSSDNATQDIGFNGSGDLDATALTTFVGAGSGYISIWYDQSGNGLNLTQATTSEQPRIVNAGTIDTENSRAFIRFFKTSVNWLKLAADMTTTGHVSLVNKFASGGDGFVLGHSTTYYYWHTNAPNFLLHSLSGASVYGGKVWQNGSYMSTAAAVFNTTLGINNIAPLTPNANTTWDNIGRDRSIYHHTDLGGGYTELIVFSTAINTYARIALEKNQATYYSITIANNYLNKYGQVTSTSSDYINRNGAVGVSGIIRNGESISNTVLSSPVTAAVSSIASSSATSGVTVASDAGGTLTTGVCWNTSTGPTTSNFKTINGGSAGTYTSNMTTLTANTTYYVRAYATNYLGTVYGSEESFTTLAPVIPTLATTAASVITGTTATSGGNVSDDGGTTVIARGVCWSTVSNPTIADSKTTDAGTTGTFTSSITGLSLGTLYYVRAYATNSVGTAYGSQISFTSLDLPTLSSTLDASSITSVSASSGGTVLTDGSTTITARGVCWSTSTAPTVALSTKTTDATGTGSFTSSITALAANTTYYARAYATNSVGTTYGSEISFTTLPPVLPTLSATTAASTIQSTSAVSGSTVVSDGGAPITVGVCWSTSTNPTIADGISSAVGTLGAYTSSLTGLTLGNTYYVRAYATNSVGTVYGSEISFTTAYNVGESYQGGIIAYLFVSGDTGYISGETHGLIAAAANQSTSAVWGCSGTAISGADGTAIGTGNQNTIDIMAGCATSGISARLCGDLVLNGYSDWYLPSKNELNRLYINKVAIGGFTTAYYASSSESSTTLLWSQSFNSGLQTTSRSKVTSLAVRAVRTF